MDRHVLIETLQQEGNLKYSFSTEEIASLAEHLTIEKIPKETILMRKGEPSDSMVFILDGLVQILDDKRQISIEKKGAFVGESLFSDEATRGADVETIEPTTVGRFSFFNFNAFLDKNQPLALKYREYFREIGRARNEQLLAESYSDKRKYLALIAHNNMKASLMEFCSIHTNKLEKFSLHSQLLHSGLVHTLASRCSSLCVPQLPQGHSIHARGAGWLHQSLRILPHLGH